MPYFSSGAPGLYSRIFQVETGYWLDNVDGLFRLVPGNINIPMHEVLPNMRSVYAVNENRQVWVDGQYHAFAYDVSGFLFAYVLNSGSFCWLVFEALVEVLPLILGMGFC